MGRSNFQPGTHDFFGIRTTAGLAKLFHDALDLGSRATLLLIFTEIPPFIVCGV
jgi:hypothetical protein